MSSFAITLLLWRPGWENAPWWQWLISLGTFGLAVICWLWMFWQLAKRRYLARYAERQATVFSAVNVDDSDRDDADEPADEPADDSRNGQTVFQMAWSRERGR